MIDHILKFMTLGTVMIGCVAILTALYTNNPPCGAMRGFGAVQACFAYEAQIQSR